MNDESKCARFMFNGWLHKIDIFSTPISLAHKSKFEFRTSIGGLFSLFVYLFMSYTVIMIAMRIFKREEIKIVESTVQNEQMTNLEYVYPFENNKFMLGIATSVYSINDSSCSSEQIKVQLYQHKIVRDEDGNRIYNDRENYDLIK